MRKINILVELDEEKMKELKVVKGNLNYNRKYSSNIINEIYLIQVKNVILKGNDIEVLNIH